MQALVGADRVPDRILHTWLITRGESFRPGQTFLHRNQVHGFYSLFHLARAFAKRMEGKHSHWIVLANDVLDVEGGGALHPEKATVLGPCEVISRELQGVTCSFIDLALEPSVAETSVLQELAAAPSNTIASWRAGVRRIRYLAPQRRTEVSPSISIRDGGTYLITGGFGGTAGVLGKWLARSYGARLVLLSRTPLPGRNEWDQWLAENAASDSISAAIRRVRELELLGAQVLPLAADTAVAEQLEDALAVARRTFGEIHGVFHTAGVLRDGLLALKSERDVEEVFAAKLYGTLVLDEALRKAQMDFLVLYSSASAFVAPVGQVDYVAANAFLNAYAQSCRGHRPWPVISINWGIWKDLGMAADSRQSHGAADIAALELSLGRPEVTHYPLFEQRFVLQDGRSQVHWITGQVSTEDSWIADEHRLRDGQALLPGTGYLELMRAALAEVDRESISWKATHLRFLAPFFVEDGRKCRFRIQLRGSRAQWQFELQTQVESTGGSSWEPVATARLAPDPSIAPEPLNVAAIAARCDLFQEDSSGTAHIRTRQEAHLRFGPRWQVLRQLRFGASEAFARLRLDAAFEADLATYALHPGLLDIATGCAMDMIPGYREQEVPQNLWVPISYASFHSYGALGSDLVSWIRLSPASDATAGVVSFDVTIADSAGRIVAEIEALTLRRMVGELRPIASTDALRSERASDRKSASSPGERALLHNRVRGITAAEGIEALERIFTMSGRPVVIASSLPPESLVRQAEAVSRLSRTDGATKFARPKLESSFEAPRDELERALADIWGRLLGVDGVGIRDSFFDLGGHSLIAVRLFNEVAEKFHADLPLSALIQHPTVAELAELIRGGPVGATAAVEPDKSIVEEPFLHAVPIKSGPVGDGTPIFVVAGMFGNVLNLSHLAQLLGEERPFYALQARGLFGDQKPHETFEEMARAYLHEVRRIQPDGPYVLGGYSGGGLVAFEMARQLEAAGEQTAALILLDTPIRTPQKFSFLDKVDMWLPGLRKEGLAYVGHKLRARREWRRQLEARDLERKAEDSSSAQFHSQRVGDAFLQASSRYEIPNVNLHATLLRPKQNVKFRLRDGRMIDGERNVLLPDNGWSAHVASLTVVEVPGNHDSMVLEPNVRVLAAAIRRAISVADRVRT
jgi:thioesterase domain-containing protein/NAD(P)-dependent dehydrogenase (short-subunit alcohol dehydrogenase family)/acyl carrier protein